MPNRQTNTRPSTRMLRVFLLVSCLALAILIPAATDCRVHRLIVPDPQTLKLKDGENVIAEAETERGKLEALINVKGKDYSEPRFSIGGKLLRETPESQVPLDIRECLKKSQVASTHPGSGIDVATEPANKWITHAAFVPEAHYCVVTATCGAAVNGKFYCVSYACCSVRGVTACSFASGLY